MDSHGWGRMRLRIALYWAIGAAPAAIAQQAGAPPAPGAESTAAQPVQGVQVFEADYFKQYNPVNAGDMVARVPGFEIIDGDDRRGFAATGGNVLVNDERPSSKATISEQLRRIPAGSVLRVELRTGSAAGSEARGQSRVVNVVLRPTADGGGPLTWVAGVRHLQYSDRLGYTLQLSKTFKLSDALELSLDVQTPNIRGRTVAFEAVRDGAGNLTRYRDQYNQPNFNGVQTAANLKWRLGPSDLVNVNALYSPTDNSTGIASVERLPNDALASATYGSQQFPANRRGELGADWEHRFGGGLSFKLIGLATIQQIESYQNLDTFTTSGLFNQRVDLRSSEGGERLARGAFTWEISPTHTLEFGAEGAFNFRDATLQVTNSNPGPTRIALTTSDTRVEEVRGEAFVTDVWKVTGDLTFEMGFNFEASRITQTGDDPKEREFTYPKPSLAATWQAGPGNIVRASVKRDVAQLDFAEFAVSINPIDDITLVGNPDLVPEQAWKTRLEWDQRFGKRGALTLGLFYDDVQDVRDLVVRDLDPGPGELLADAVGNLGDGTRVGLDVRAAAPLDGLGVKRADLRVSAIWQETNVTDPLTGMERSFSSGENSNQGPRTGGSGGGPPPLNVGNRDWGYTVSVRQELPKLKSSWAVSVARNAARQEFKLLESVVLDRPVDRVDLSWETTAFAGLTTRFAVGNVFSPQEERLRTFFEGDRRSGIVERTERRTNKGGPEGTRSISIQISGRF